MSGRQQHYLPQFLQRNFHARKNGKEHYVHVHMRASSIQPNTAGVGQQRDFYGNPESSGADAKLTYAETMLSSVVQRLMTSDAASVSQEEFAILVASISLRTKKMREALKIAGPRIMAALVEVTNVTKLAGQEFDKIVNDKKQIDSLIDAELAKVPQLNRNQVRQFKTVARSRLIQEARRRRDTILSEIKMQFDIVMSKLIADASSIADGAFLKIFEGSAAPDPRVAMFKELYYTVIEAPAGESFILGDCAVVAVQSDGKPKLALGNVDDELVMSEVWLPISPLLAMVGRRGNFDAALGVNDVNRLSAMLSHEFFISDRPLSKTNSALPSLIGTAEPLLTSNELAVIAQPENN